MKGYVPLRRGLIEHLKIMSFSELKVYIGLLLLANYRTACVNITVAKLYDILGTDYKNTLNSIHRLVAFGYVKYTPSKNQWRDSQFEILKYKSGEMPMEKITLPIPEAIPQAVPEAVPEANSVTTNDSNDLRNPNKYKEVLRSKKNIYMSFWNSLGLIQHRHLSEACLNHINAKITNGYTEQDILQSMKNYAHIVKEPRYFWKYKWTLDEFITRGLDKFMDLETAKSNYLDKNYKPEATEEEKKLNEQLKEVA